MWAHPLQRVQCQNLYAIWLETFIPRVSPAASTWWWPRAVLKISRRKNRRERLSAKSYGACLPLWTDNRFDMQADREFDTWQFAKRAVYYSRVQAANKLTARRCRLRLSSCQLQIWQYRQSGALTKPIPWALWLASPYVHYMGPPTPIFLKLERRLSLIRPRKEQIRLCASEYESK